MFSTPAYAQGLMGGGPDGGLGALLPLVLIFAVFYFLLIRPQQKRMKEHKSSIDAIRRGDKVVLGGGIMGTVTKVVSDVEVLVEIADGVRVRVQRALISAVAVKGQPVEGEAKAANDASDPTKPAAPVSGWKSLFGGKK
jgi:preprotein translocase subunit YajC